MASLERYRSAPRRPPPAVSQSPMLHALAPFALLYTVYTLVRWALAGHASQVGSRNADTILRFEQWLGLDIERALQTWLLGHPPLISLFNYYYVFAFFPVLVVAAIWGVRAVPAAFETARHVFAISLAIALVIFAILPLAPPRLLPEAYGYVDTLMLYGPRYYGDASGASLFNLYGSIPTMVNEYAAMPSMHVGWSIIAGWLLFVASGRRWWVGLLATLHIVAMEIVVVSTGNHYLVDGIAGILVVLIAWGIVRWHVALTNAVPAPGWSRQP